MVFGDLGVHTHTIPFLVEEALKGEYTALLHVGDFAYNLKDKDGLVSWSGYGGGWLGRGGGHFKICLYVRIGFEGLDSFAYPGIKLFFYFVFYACTLL